MSKYFALEKSFPKEFWSNKRVIEVGSGTGIVGIAAAVCGLITLIHDLKLGADIIITDLEPQVKLIQENIDLLHDPNLKVKAEVLCWYHNKFSI